LLFWLSHLKAETTYGICYLQEEPDGKNIAEIDAGVYVMAAPHNNIYSRVLLECWIYKKDLYEDLRINSKVKLYGVNGKKIGKTTTDFNPFKFIQDNDSIVLIQIAAYLQNASINPQSVPEIDLTNLLLNVSVNAKLNFFRQHIKNFNYQFTQETNDYTSYVIYEPDFAKQVLNPRILMVFFKEELIAVFYTRFIKVKHYDSIEMGNDYKMIYNSKFTEHTKTQMMSIYKQKLNKLK